MKRSDAFIRSLPKVVLHDHPFNKDLMISEVYEVPFRELWMRDGKQSFDPLITLQTV